MFDENNNNDFGSGKIDYQGLAQNLASQVPDVLDSDIPELNRQYIIKKVQNYCVLAGEALNNDNTFCSTQDEKIFIVQIVGEWTYHKCLDLYRSHVSAEYYEEILQKIAFVVYEIAKQGIIRKIEQRDLIDVIEYHVVKTYKEALDELKDKDAISEEIYQLAINESNLDKLAEKFGKDDSDLDELQSISFSPLKDLESSSSSALVLNEEAKSSLVKAHWKYCLNNICLVAFSLLLTTTVYFYVNGYPMHFGEIMQVSCKVLFKPIYLLGLVVVIGLKDLLKYLFCGLSTDENKYLVEVEKENQSISGIKRFVSGESIKARFGLMFALLSLLAIALFGLCVKCWRVFLYFGLYYGVSLYLKLPFCDFKNIVFSKEFFIPAIALFLVFKCLDKKKQNA